MRFLVSFRHQQVEKEILEYDRLLARSARSDPGRPSLLLRLSSLRVDLYELSNQQSDCDKSITHLTEAALTFQTSKVAVNIFFTLALSLAARFSHYKQPEDIRSSLQYLRFLRINFHPLETIGIPNAGDLIPALVFALSQNLALGSGEMMQDMEELVALIPEILSSTLAIRKFAEAVMQTNIFRRRHTQQVADRVINMLRDATVPNPDSYASYALASCLYARFQTTHVINDYEEAIAIADKLFADTPGDDRSTIDGVTALILCLSVFRMDLYPKPDYLEDTIHRFRTLLSITTLSDRYRTQFAYCLDIYTKLRFNFFGVTGNSTIPSSDPSPASFITPVLVISQLHRGGVAPEDDITQYQEKYRLLHDILATIKYDETTDVEAAVDKAVELSRTFLPLQKSSGQWAFIAATAFCILLFEAYQRTNKLDYLNKSIPLNRDLLKVLSQVTARFMAKQSLLYSLTVRFNLLRQREDEEEGFQLYPLLVNDESGEVSHRFKISYEWATGA